ncbi:MAG TPA: DUF1501 domain-containing protein [Verrucomicrobiae bacterium]|nr:DUF1501 domain-containing protein [Verrucomicrobiae bacterium]
MAQPQSTPPAPAPVHHCGRFLQRPLTRRALLRQAANGFGGIALLGLLADRAFGKVVSQPQQKVHNSLVPRPAHAAARARQIIFLYMDGGPSQVDTFDPKPRLNREHGKPFAMKMEPTQFNNNGNTLGCPWAFRNYGRSGIPVSDLFPYVGQCVDDLCVIRSMVSDFSEHTNANYFLHTGLGLVGRPSMGAWVSYGLGTENQNLPGFVVLNGGLIPPGGLENFGSGFLPATFQGSIFRAAAKPVANVQPLEARPELQQDKLALLRKLDAGVLERLGHLDQIESAIANYELAFRMQSAVPELMDIHGESEATRKLYGLEAAYPHTRTFALQCLIARRLVERGVRFVELTCPPTGGDRWDQHGGLKSGHTNNALAVDQPIAGLLTDLKARGLLERTLVLWAGEFGRTPFAQGFDGRDHNPFGFSVWLAGGGVKGGMIYGATDDYGYKVVERKVHMHDLHATLLHLLGLDHTRLTVRFSGRDMRLTDVFGEVAYDILAS